MNEMHISAYPPEAELLIACARRDIDAATQERIRNIARSGVDWDRVINLSKLHGTAPLLYGALSNGCQGLAPPEFFRSLQQYYGVIVIQNTRMANALVEITGALQAASIPFRCLKGPAVALLAYDNVTAREFGDLDLLIRKRDLPAAVDTLTRRGFVYSIMDDEGQPSWSKRKYHVLRRKSDGVVVDLQWMLAHQDFSFSLGDKTFWDRTQLLELSGVNIPTLSPDATLLLLCIHGSKHLWSHLKWTCDVAEILRRYPNLDWEWLVAASRRFGCTRIVLLGLLLARDVLDAPVTSQILSRLGTDPLVEKLAAQLAKRLFVGEDPSDPAAFNGAEYMVLRTRLFDKLRFLAHLCIAISPADRASLKAFPATFRTLYYAFLPLRTIGRRLPVPRLKTAVSEWLERMG